MAKSYNPFSIFRKNQKVALALITLLSMFAFVCVGPSMMGRANNGGGGARTAVPLAKWNYGEITRGEVDDKLMWRKRINRFLSDVHSQAVALGKADPDRQVRLFLPDDKEQGEESILQAMVLAKKAELLGMTVSDQTINDYIDAVTNNSLDQAAKEKALGDVIGEGHGAGSSADPFFDALRFELLARNFGRLLDSDSVDYDTPEERWEYFSRLYREATVQALPVAVKDFVDKVPNPSTDELERLFDNYKDRLPQPELPDPGFMAPARGKFQYFKAVRATLSKADEPKITDKEIDDFYKQHKEDFRKAAFPESALPGGEKPKTGTNLPSGEAPKTGAAPKPDDKTGTTPKAGAAPATSTTNPAPNATSPSNPTPASTSPTPKTGTPPTTTPTTNPAPTSTPPAGTPPANTPPTGTDKSGTDKSGTDKSGADKSGADKSGADNSKPTDSSGDNKSSDSRSHRVRSGDEELLALADAPPSATPPSATPPATSPTQSAPPPSNPAPAATPPAATPPVTTPPAATAPSKSAAPATTPAPAASTPPNKTPTAAASSSAPSASTKPATTTPATASPSATTPGPDEFDPVTDPKVRSSIRTTLANQKATAEINEAFRKLRTEVQIYGRQVSYWIADGSPKDQVPQVPDFREEAKNFGLTFEETGLMSAEESLQKSELGTSMAINETNFTPIRFVNAAFDPNLASFMPSESMSGDAELSFLWWRTQYEPAYVPTFNDVKPEVTRAWKMIQARTLAMNEAKKDAETANRRMAKLKAIFQDRPNMTVSEIGPFHWLTLQNVPMGDSMQQVPYLTRVSGLDLAGEEFMRAVFSTDEGHTTTAFNQPQTIAYVVQVQNIAPTEDVFRRLFQNYQIQSATKQSYGQAFLAAEASAQRVSLAKLEQIEKDLGFKMLAATSPGQPSGGPPAGPPADDSD